MNTKLKAILITIMSIMFLGMLSSNTNVKAIDVTGGLASSSSRVRYNHTINNDVWGQYELYYGGSHTSYVWDVSEGRINGYRTLFKVNGGGENVIQAPNATGWRDNVSVTTSFQTITESDGSKSMLVVFTAKNNNASTVTVDICTYADISIGDDDNSPIKVLYQNGEKIGFSVSNLKAHTSMKKVSLNYYFKNNRYVADNTKYVTSHYVWTGSCYDAPSNRWNNAYRDVNPDEWHNVTTGTSGWTDVGFATSWKLSIPAGGEGKASYVLTTFDAKTTYNVTYHPNGGSGSSYTKQGTAWKTFTFDNCSFTKSGYECIGWSTDPNSSRIDYAFNQSITLTNDMTVYAVWRDNVPPEHGYWLDENTRYTNAADGTTFRVHAQGAWDGQSGIDAMYLWVSTDGGANWNKISGARMNEWNNNGTRAWYYDVPISGEGQYLCHTCPVDRAGNWRWGGPNEYMIVDRTPPKVTGISTSKYYYAAGTTNVQVTFSGMSDDRSGLKTLHYAYLAPGASDWVYVETPNTSESTSVNIPISTEGVYNIAVKTIDRAGNWSNNTSDTYGYLRTTFVYDGTVPLIEQVPERQIYNELGKTVTFSIKVTDLISGLDVAATKWYIYAGETLWMEVENANYDSNTHMLSKTVTLPDGTDGWSNNCTFNARPIIYDKAGNYVDIRQDISKQIQVIIDTIPPEGTANIPKHTMDGLVTVTVQATDEIGMAYVEFPTWSEVNGQDDIVWYKVNGEGPNYSITIDLKNHTPGTSEVYDVHVYGTDKAGNKQLFGTQRVIYSVPLITNWTVSANTTIKLPIPGNVNNSFMVDWGDGKSNIYTSEAYPIHTYDTANTYTVKVSGFVKKFGYAGYEEPTATNTYKDYYIATQYITGLKAWGELWCEEYGFSWCKNLSGSIPAPNDASFTNITRFYDTFFNCLNLTGSIPANLFAKAPKVTTFTGTFYGCSKLSGSISGGLFANTPNVTSFEGTFYDCQNLTGSIAANLFANTPNVTSFEGTFYDCKNLTGSIPAELFANTPNVTSFEGTFYDCKNLTGNIPAELFANTSKVTSFYSTFDGCSKVTGSIPAGLFANTPNVTTFENTFKYCENLTGSIPEQLFVNTSNVTTFKNTFSNCKSLTGHISRNLFTNTPNATNFERIFENCTKLTSGEININTMNVINVDSMFKGCTSLESIAFSSDFEKLDGVTMFKDCSSLKAIILFKDASSQSEVPNLGDLATIGLPEQTIIYVPTREAEKVYEVAYQNRFDDEQVIDEVTKETVTRNIGIRRIEPILGLVGDNPTYTQKGEPYVDAGYTVAGFKIAEEAKYQIYGFTVSIEGLPVDTATIGTKLVNYIIVHRGNTGMNLIRQVIVKELNFEKLDVLINPTVYEYDGEEKMPKVYVKLDGVELIKGTDYSVEYLDNKNAGTGKIVINSMGIYKNNWVGNFTITPRKLVITPENGLVKFAGQNEPIIPFQYSNQVEGEEPKFTGELSREKAGTAEGEVAGDYTITQGTLQTQNNGAFLTNNYRIEITPEVVKVIGEIEKVFITKWQVSAGMTIQLPIPSNEENQYIVTWGDRTQGSYTKESFPTHTYETDGEYEINIYGVCKNYGYVGEQIPSSNNTQKDYYSFTQNLIGIEQWGDIEAERFGFSYCMNLTGSIPKTTGFSKLNSMENLFNQCTNLVGPIPEKFTADAYEIKNIRNLFNNCINLTGEIPEDLLEGKNKITTCENTFQNCKKLTGSIPEKLFKDAENVISYQATFKNCTGITGYLPQNLFLESYDVENFRETFANCSGITTEQVTIEDSEFEFIESTLPENFLYGNPKVRNYYHMFYNCTGLTGEVREDLLSNNIRIRNISNANNSYTDYRGMFEGCTGIEKVSLGILAYGKEMFKNCTGIQEIDLRNTLEVGESAFYGCNQLQNITIDENYFKTIGKDAFEYTGTDPKLLLTKVNKDNEVLVNYEWLEDNRILDVEAPKGTVKIVTEKYPFTKTQAVTLQLTVTDNYSRPENCQMAIVNELEYEAGVCEEELNWQPFTTQIEWDLTADDGAKIVYAYFKDESGNICESLDYIAGRIKIVSNTGSITANQPIEVSLVSTFSGNNRQKNYHFRKEIKVYREGESAEFQEYFNPIAIEQEGNTFVEARFIETTTGIVIDETMAVINIDTLKPEKVTYNVERGTLNGNIYYGEYLGDEDANSGVVLQITEGKDYNALGEESYGIEEIRYSLVKDGNKIIENETLDSNNIYLNEIGSYVVIVTEVDVHGNYSEAETIQVQITDGR